MKKVFLMMAAVLLGGLVAGAAEIKVGGPREALVSVGPGPKAVVAGFSDASRWAQIRGTLVRHGDGATVEGTGWDGYALYFDVPELGYYDLNLELILDGEVLASKKSNYAVVPYIAERPAEMGACVHFAQGKGAYPLTYDLLAMAGVSRVREDLPWEAVEPRAGVYQMPEYADLLVARCEEYGIKPLFVFGYANGAAYPDHWKEKAFPTDDVTRQGCAGAMAYAVGHFGNRVLEWELWNEPNYADPVKDYLPLLKFVYPAVKAANPDITLISGGGSGAGGGPGGGFIWPIFVVKGQDWQDGWSIHPYMVDPDFGYEAAGGPIPRVSIPVVLPFLKNMAAQHPRSDGCPLSLWITELGWSVYNGSQGVSEQQQAAYLARMFLLCRREKASPGIYWYDFQNDGDSPDELEHNFGVIRTDYSPKPAYQAQAVAAALLGNRPFQANWLEGEEFMLSFGYGKSEFFAAWTVKPEGCRVELDWPEHKSRLMLVDWQGREMPLETAPSGRLQLNLSPLPQYLIVK